MSSDAYVVYDIKEPGLRINWSPVAGSAVEEAKRNKQRVFNGGGMIRVPECLDEAFAKAHEKLITDGRLVRRGQSLPRVKAGTKPAATSTGTTHPPLAAQPPAYVPAPEEKLDLLGQQGKEPNK